MHVHTHADTTHIHTNEHPHTHTYTYVHMHAYINTHAPTSCTTQIHISHTRYKNFHKHPWYGYVKNKSIHSTSNFHSMEYVQPKLGLN